MSRQARLGLLVTSGTILFVLMLFLLARRSFLFSDVYTVSAEFSTVAGLEAGAPVQYRGIAVGSVELVALPSAPHLPIRVDMAIQREAGQLIRSDSRAQIKSDGVLGNQLVVLTGGSDTASPIEPGGMIAGLEPLDIMDIADRAMSTVAVFDSVIVSMNAVLKQIENGDGTVGRLFNDPTLYNRSLQIADNAERAINGLTSTIDSLGIRIDATLSALDEVVQNAGYGDGSLATLINDPALHEQLLTAGHKLDNLLGEVDSLVSEARTASEWGTVALYRTAENMAALQRHWLFRRYFRDRPEGLEFAADSLLKARQAGSDR